jgi:hypothetical protein
VGGLNMRSRDGSISRDFGTPGCAGLYPSIRSWKLVPSEQSRVRDGCAGDRRTLVRTRRD